MATPEQLHLARELHDGIAQDLVALGYSLDLLLSQSDLPLGARASIRSSRLQVDHLMLKVRREIFNLREKTEKTLATQVRALLSLHYSDFETKLDIEDVSANSEIEDELLAITREILRNIRLHARASRIGVTLYPVNNRICLQICDNGIGGAGMKNGHWGLTGISERVTRLGGAMTIENHFDDNTGVRITILL
jgi:signal transduction histidine kinase